MTFKPTEEELESILARPRAWENHRTHKNGIAGITERGLAALGRAGGSDRMKLSKLEREVLGWMKDGYLAFSVAEGSRHKWIFYGHDRTATIKRLLQRGLCLAHFLGRRGASKQGTAGITEQGKEALLGEPTPEQKYQMTQFDIWERKVKSWKQQLIQTRGVANVFATPQEIDAARDLHQGENINIDDDALASYTPGGYWVQAWVWVGPEEKSDADI